MLFHNSLDCEMQVMLMHGVSCQCMHLQLAHTLIYNVCNPVNLQTLNSTPPGHPPAGTCCTTGPAAVRCVTSP
jgi:hypothetical protein